MMALKAALFDLDGTLLDSLPLITSTFQKAFKQFNIPWGNGDVVKWIGRPLVEIARHFAGNERWEEFINLYQSIYAVDHDCYTRLYPGAIETLAGLKQEEVHLGIVTSKRRPATMRSLEFLRLTDLFNVIITANDVARHKPDPEPVLKALEILDISPDNAVFVGDSPFDIASGKRAGVYTVGVTWGMADSEELKRCKPDELLDDWKGLHNFFITNKF